MTQVETERKTIFWSRLVFVHFRPALCRIGHSIKELRPLDAVRVCGSVLEDVYATMALEKRP